MEGLQVTQALCVSLKEPRSTAADAAKGCCSKATHRHFLHSLSARAGRRPGTAQLSTSPAGWHRSLQSLVTAGLLWESAHCSLGRGLLWVARDTMSLSLGFFSFHHTAKYPRKPVRLGSTQQHPGLLSIHG